MKINHLPHASGVYKLEHLATGRLYVGSAVNLLKRARLHTNELRTGKHPNKKLLNAWRKYGGDAFVVEVLALCPPDALLHTEQVFIDTLTPHYNLCPTAGSTLGLKWTDEARTNAKVAQRQFAEDNVELKARCGRQASETHSNKLKTDPDYRRDWLVLRKAVMRKKARFITLGGKTQTLEEWATELQVDRSTILHRIKRWGLTRALTEASRKGTSHNARLVEYDGELVTLTALSAILGVNRASFCEYADRNGFGVAVAHYERKRKT